MGVNISKTKDDEFEIQLLNGDLETQTPIYFQQLNVLRELGILVIKENPRGEDHFERLLKKIANGERKQLCDEQNICINGVTLQNISEKNTDIGPVDTIIKVTRDIYNLPNWTSDHNIITRSKVSGRIRITHKNLSVGRTYDGQSKIYFETLQIKPGWNLLERNVTYINNPSSTFGDPDIGGNVYRDLGTFKNLFPETYKLYTFYNYTIIPGVYDDCEGKCEGSYIIEPKVNWEQITNLDTLVKDRFIVFNPTQDTNYLTIAGAHEVNRNVNN